MAKVLYAVVSYALMLASLLWSVLFLADLGGVRTIDSGAAPPWGQALALDLALLLFFGVQHSVMARPGFKRVWTRFVPSSIERATYVLASALALLLLLAIWEPMPAVVWEARDPAVRALLFALYGVGWGVVLLSTFLIDHFHLFGLKQAWRALRQEAAADPSFRTVLLYRLVRHPIMLGFLIAFWATPKMTVGHLVLTLAWTAYILVGVHLEERDLRAALGATYERYREEVPMLLPVPRRRR